MAWSYVALLRGINVGGHHLIPMKDLAAAFEDLGFADVRTYIQSGNVLFRGAGNRTAAHRTRIESGLSETFGYDAKVVVMAGAAYRDAVAAAHPSFGQDDDRKHNAMFTLAGTSPADVLAALPPPKGDLETVSTAPGVIFWSASKAGLGRTAMMTLTKRAAYKTLTVRNHKTTFKLRDLLGEMG